MKVKKEFILLVGIEEETVVKAWNIFWREQ